MSKQTDLINIPDAITVDGSENVLIGKATDAFGTAGIGLRGTVADFTRDGNTPVNVNRLTNDGRLIALHKDSAVVGSIGVTNGTNAIFDSQGGTLKLGTVGTERYNFDLDQIYPTVDNDTNLGATSHRFRNAYLSGGIYLGGTGSANKLSDFESGTWTPTLGGNAQYDIQSGDYIKVGGLVYASFAIRPTSLGTGSTKRVSGLPFSTADSVGISIQYYDGAATNHYSILGGVTSNYIDIFLKTSAINSAYNSTNFFQSNSRIYASVIYRTTA